MNRQTIAKLSAVVITIALVAILLSQIEVSDVITTLAGIDPLYLIAGFGLYIFKVSLGFFLMNNHLSKNIFSSYCLYMPFC